MFYNFSFVHCLINKYYYNNISFSNKKRIKIDNNNSIVYQLYTSIINMECYNKCIQFKFEIRTVICFFIIKKLFSENN